MLGRILQSMHSTDLDAAVKCLLAVALRHVGSKTPQVYRSAVRAKPWGVPPVMSTMFTSYASLVSCRFGMRRILRMSVWPWWCAQAATLLSASCWNTWIRRAQDHIWVWSPRYWPVLPWRLASAWRDHCISAARLPGSLAHMHKRVPSICKSFLLKLASILVAAWLHCHS